MSEPTAYVVTLKPPDGADGLQLLQAALKTLGRRHQLRCLSIEPAPRGAGRSDEPSTKPPAAPPITPRLMTMRQTATYLGLAVQTIRNHAGELPGRKKFGTGKRGGRVLYDRAAIDEWVEQNDGVRDLWLDARQMRG